MLSMADPEAACSCGGLSPAPSCLARGLRSVTLRITTNDILFLNQVTAPVLTELLPQNLRLALYEELPQFTCAYYKSKSHYETSSA